MSSRSFSAENADLDFFEEEARVLSASKYPQRVSDAPAATQIVTAEDIANYGYRTLADALQSIPGIYGTCDRNYTYLWVRGFGRPADYNNRILLLINGHRINENVYGSNYVGYESLVDISSVERIEVVKGPASALYGDNAFFAVVNVVTRGAGSSPPARARTEGGSYGTHREFAEASHRHENGWEWYAAGAYRRMQGRDLVYPEFSGTNGGKAENADREESKSFYASLSRPGWMLQGGLNVRDKTLPTAPFGTRFNDNGTFTTDTRSFFEISMLDLKVHENVRLTGRSYVDGYGYHADYVYDNSTPPPDLLINKDVVKSAWYGEEVRGRFTFFGDEHPLLLGEEFEKSLLGRQINYDQDPHQDYLDDNRAEYRWALFGQQELRLRSDLVLTLGLRYDRYEAFGHVFNPRTAVVYHPWRGSSLKLLYGTAFRGPTPFERFYTAGAMSVANPGLVPEKIRTYEVAFEQEYSSRRFLSVSLFRNKITDLISQITRPDGSIQYVNNEHVRTEGAEFYAKGDMTKNLSAHLGYTLQSTRIEGGDRLSNSPTHIANLGLSRLLTFRKSRISLEGFLVSARRTYQGSTLPATGLLSVAVRTAPGPEGLDVYASVQNVLDTEYRVSGAAEHTQSAIQQDGRNYLLGLEYRFGVARGGR
ncbi:MAG: TonB-dependent receptor [Elusimicrobiota bacterium]